MKPGLYELDRREPAVCAVGPAVVVVDAPVLGKDLSLEEAVEELAVQVLVTHSAVEALDPSVLPR